MEMRKDALENLIDSLEAKGFGGHYLINGGYPGTLQDSLSRFMGAEPGWQSRGFLMETYLEWNGEDKDCVHATLFATLEKEQINISRIDVIRNDRYGQRIAVHSLKGLSTATLPDRQEAVNNVKLPLRRANAIAPRNGFKFVLVALMALAFQGANAQGTWFKEWFRQKSTQREYLALQIAALKGYAQVARKGYDIARKGLTVIGNIKNGDLNIHRDFFGSLKGVNPAIKNHEKVGDIVAMQVEILQAYNRDYKSLQGGNMLSGSELAYVSRVYGRMLDDCSRLVDELMALTADGRLEMKDDERIQRIETLYEEMQGNKAFCLQFGGEATLLSAQRQHGVQETENARILNGLP